MRDDFTQLMEDSGLLRAGTRWSDVEDRLRDDPRFKAVPDAHEREGLFRDLMVVVERREAEERRRMREARMAELKEVRGGERGQGARGGAGGQAGCVG